MHYIRVISSQIEQFLNLRVTEFYETFYRHSTNKNTHTVIFIVLLIYKTFYIINLVPNLYINKTVEGVCLYINYFFPILRFLSVSYKTKTIQVVFSFGVCLFVCLFVCSTIT